MIVASVFRRSIIDSFLACGGGGVIATGKCNEIWLRAKYAANAFVSLRCVPHALHNLRQQQRTRQAYVKNAKPHTLTHTVAHTVALTGSHILVAAIKSELRKNAKRKSC